MKNWILIGVVILATSCSLIKKKDASLIEKDTFTNVLVDIHFADALITEKGYRITSDSLRISMYYDDVFKKHSVSRKQFDSTVDYYSKNSEEYKMIYDEVILRLTKLKDELQEEKTK